MIDLNWHDYYEIGVDFIDAEHQNILKIMREIRDAILAEKYSECTVLTTKMIVTAEEHFKHEEEFLRDVKYPGLREHAEYHLELLVQAKRVKTLCEKVEQDHNLLECFEAMEEFLIDDIFTGDIAFKSYLEYEGIIPRNLGI